jgi:hypothetical protein
VPAGGPTLILPAEEFVDCHDDEVDDDDEEEEEVAVGIANV